jgi:hydrogenase maturation factor
LRRFQTPFLPISAARVSCKPQSIREDTLHRKSFRDDKKLKTNAFVLRHRQTIRFMLAPGSHRKEVTMPAIAEVLPTGAHNADPRGCDLPTCPVCADSMVAAEASAYVTDNVISYLWTCDTCGYGFVTKHALTRFACN